MNSEKIKTLLQDFRVSITVGVVLGLILGLVIGWGIWPVQWTDLAPYHLRADLREDYLRMAIFTTSMTGDATIAEKAWSELEDTAEETMGAVSANPGYLQPEQIASFAILVNAETDMTGIVSTQTIVTSEATAAGEEETTREGPNWFLIILLGLVLLGAAALVIYFFLFRNRNSAEDQSTLQDRRAAVMDQPDEYGYEDDVDYGDYQEPSKEAYEAPYSGSATAPVAQFMTTYMVGDDLYDDSFSIDAPTGEFLGECGVGISDTVGVGEPKRVSALEVWLFDKYDIQTVTKVMMSEHTYEDNKVRMRLESKGEPILAEPGKQILLETATLQLEARIVDMEYGSGAAPDQSFFQRLTLELSIWSKERSNY